MKNLNPHRETDEAALWSGVKRGDQIAFEALYKTFFRPLYNYGKKICSHSTVVEDAIHDLFLDLWKYRENLSTTTSIKFYLFRSLRRRIIKNGNKDFESTIFKFEYEEIFPGKAVSCEDVVIETESQNERIKALKKHLNNLSPRHYESLTLRFFNDFSYKEIGSILEINEQSARNLVQRGLDQLRHFSKILS